MKWVKTIITIILLVLVCVAIYYGGLLGPIMTSGETYEKNGVTFIYPGGGQKQIVYLKDQLQQ